MGAWDRSWSITQTSFSIIRKDSEMLWFPILSGFFSLLFSAALIVPTFVLDLAQQAGGERLVVGPLQYAVLFVTYFGLAFIATFFNVCVVFTTRVRLSGGDATFMDSIKFALSRIHLIAGWSLVSATVGILLRALDNMAQKSGLVGKILLMILRAILASAWSVMTVFVIPAMVYRDLGPIDAIKESAETLKRTWGEALTQYWGVGLASFVCSLPCIALLVGGGVLVGQVPAAGIALIVLGVVGLLAVSLVFGVASTVWKTVLYHWATNGSVPPGYDAAMLQSAFAPKG
jgi:membrane-anchored glycerophosphoryl diester phosphodiesterase (GDPDase)